MRALTPLPRPKNKMQNQTIQQINAYLDSLLSEEPVKAAPTPWLAEVPTIELRERAHALGYSGYYMPRNQLLTVLWDN